MTARRLVPFGVVVALLALLLWLSGFPVDTDEQENREADGSTSSPPAVSANPPEAMVVPVTIDAAESAVAFAGDNSAPEAESPPDYCGELSRQLEVNPGASIRIFNDEADDEEASNRRCGLALQVLLGDGVPALPGIAGFEVRDFGEFVSLNPRKRLFEESDEPAWSRPTENGIYDEIQRLIDFPVVTLHVVCRSSTCGLVYAFPSSNLRGDNYNYYAREIADALGFSGFHGGVAKPASGIWYTYIYLGDWVSRRVEIPDLPTNSISGLSN